MGRCIGWLLIRSVGSASVDSTGAEFVLGRVRGFVSGPVGAFGGVAAP